MASEYLKWKYRFVEPDAPVERTRAQKAANWWHYHKGWLLAGAILLIALADIGSCALGFGRIRPDGQAACVASAPLSDEALSALEAALAACGEDCNGDGHVCVQVNAYVDMAASPERDSAQYAAAAKVRLMADLEACESYFFICDDYETLHAQYDILADESGEIASNPERVEGYPLRACPALAPLLDEHPELGALTLCRRGFWENRTCQYVDACDRLWDKLTGEATA